MSGGDCIIRRTQSLVLQLGGPKVCGVLVDGSHVFAPSSFRLDVKVPSTSAFEISKFRTICSIHHPVPLECSSNSELLTQKEILFAMFGRHHSSQELWVANRRGIYKISGALVHATRTGLSLSSSRFLRARKPYEGRYLRNEELFHFSLDVARATGLKVEFLMWY
jgi:hypothetical protein